MLDVLTGFVHELRAAGLPVSLTEDIDVMEALRHVPIEDRRAFKHALGATLVKSQDHAKAFDSIFEAYFSARFGAAALPAGAEHDLDALLAQAFLSDDDSVTDAAVKAAAAQAVARYAGMEQGRPVGGRYYLHRTLRHLDLDGLLERLAGGDQHHDDEALTPLDEELLADEHRTRAERLRAEVDAEIRRRLVAERGAEALARTVRSDRKSVV